MDRSELIVMQHNGARAIKISTPCNDGSHLQTTGCEASNTKENERFEDVGVKNITSTCNKPRHTWIDRRAVAEHSVLITQS